MKKWVKNYKHYFLGAIVGGLAGFLYWKFIGCSSGSCAITSHPVRSTIYFAIVGMLVIGAFKKQAA